MNKQRLVIAIVVKDGLVISYATNEHKNECKRIGYPTGIGYELCDGCNYSNHAEYKALKKINEDGLDIYLLGHTYACNKCLEEINKHKANLFII